MSAFTAALNVPWAIRPEALQWMLDIASRRHTPDFEAAVQRLAARQREIDPSALSLSSGRALDGTKTIKMRGSVAVLPIEGPLFRYANLFSEMSGASSLEMLAKDFRVALTNPDVEAILLHVDSPGGEVNGTGEFADHIYSARGRKPIWAYVSNEGASAAYWIASACDRIVCAPTSLLGSIGVVAAIPDPSADDTKRIQFVSSQSPNKRPDLHTEEGKATIQTVIDDIASQFVSTVARHRGVEESTVLSDFGAGGVMVGQKAVDAGLADAIGNFEQCVASITKSNAQEGVPNDHTTARSASTDIDTSASSPLIESPSIAPDGTKGNFTPSTRKGRRTTMSLRDRILAAINGTPEDELEAEDESPQPTVAVTRPQPAVTAVTAPTQVTATDLENRQLRDRLARVEDENRRIKAARMQEKAEAFYSTLLAANRVVPAEQAGIIQGYVRAATDDEVLPLPDGGSRVEQFEAMYTARPANMLMAEAVPDALNEVIMLRNKLQTGGASLHGRTPEGHAMSGDRKKALLSMTDLGRQVINGRN